MNNQNLMMQRKAGDGVPEYEKKDGPQELMPAHNNTVMQMVRRSSAAAGPGGVPVQEKKVMAVPDGTEAAAPEKTIPGTPAPAVAAAKAPAAKPAGGVGVSKDELAARTAAMKERAAAATKTAVAGASSQGKPPAQPAAKPAAKPGQPAQAQMSVPRVAAPSAIGMSMGPDELAQAYIKMFKDTMGVDLSPSIVFENMRRLCEPDVKDPLKTLYFLENTYRVSTLLYLAGNLPILVVTSILAEKNRKNILKYVTIEVENGTKPYDQLRDIRIKRWARKYENMAVNDAMTVTPGATMLTPELANAMLYEFGAISSKLKKFDKEMSTIVEKFDTGTRNDVVYIYSNWWYLLQGFENVPEMRSYVMAITDDTRRNLKI